MKAILFMVSMLSAGDSVYVCSGKASTKYHKVEFCRGLETCTTKISSVSLKAAVDSLKRTPCFVCFKRKKKAG